MKKLFRCALALTLVALAGCDMSVMPVSVSSQGIVVLTSVPERVEQVCVDGVVYIRIYTATNNSPTYVPKFNTESKVVTCAGPAAPAVKVEVPPTASPFRTMGDTPAPSLATIVF